MVARISKIHHPLGFSFETPLLISSFSSKGFKFIENSKSGVKSEVGQLIRETSEAITECALVSAFDLKYYLGSGEDLIRKCGLLPTILFIDSGGYETIEDYDFTEVYKYPIKSQQWTSKMYEEELNKLSKVPAVLVSYDNGQEKRLPLNKQIERAKRLFSKYPNQLSDFLIKPSKKRDHHLDIDEIINNISLLKSFTIIGVTEKELGESILERVKNIRIIREHLDKVGCKSPLHIFGNLDPLISILYFINGAEIFDGLTWLRFAFHNGMAVYKNNVDVLEGRAHEKDNLNNKMIMMQNLIYLRKLTQEMKSFVHTANDGSMDAAYQCFQNNGDKIKQINASLK